MREVVTDALDDMGRVVFGGNAIVGSEGGLRGGYAGALQIFDDSVNAEGSLELLGRAILLVLLEIGATPHGRGELRSTRCLLY